MEWSVFSKFPEVGLIFLTVKEYRIARVRSLSAIHAPQKSVCQSKSNLIKCLCGTGKRKMYKRPGDKDKIVAILIDALKP